MDTLSVAEVRALNEALDDEYRSWATYDQVIADFGEILHSATFVRRRHVILKHFVHCLSVTHYPCRSTLARQGCALCQSASSV